MLLARIVLAAGIGALVADAAPTLHVLRASPQGVAAPTATITVAFDRPVAGGLDRAVDPAGLLSIEPAIEGTLDWRDPVTLRFRPAAPLPSNTEFTVTVGEGVTAMDGARLEEPYRFSFQVRGPRVLAGSPAGSGDVARFLAPDATFEIVLDAPADRAMIARGVRIEPGTLCADRAPIAVRVVEQRPVADDDPWQFREAGGWDRDRSVDSLRRVVRVAPERPLPRGCAGMLVLPAAFDMRGAETLQWPFATYGDFRIASASCGWRREFCATGPAVVEFSTPVKGAELLRHVTIMPELSFVVPDTAAERAVWALEGTLKPRTGYVVIADTAMRDVFGQRLTGNPVATVVTTGYAPSVDHLWGRATVERKAFRTLPVTYVNVDTLAVTVVPIPRRLEATFMSLGQWAWNDSLRALTGASIARKVAVTAPRDRIQIYGVPLPASDAARGGATLYAVQVDAASRPVPPKTGDAAAEGRRAPRPLALVQVTDLGVHAKIGESDGAVWVTGASDGQPRAGARVVLHDRRGRELAAATTDSSGLARLQGWTPPPRDENDPYSGDLGYVAVTLGPDRALVGVNGYDPDLNPWRFGARSAWGPERVPAAGAVFTERGIYRPGESLYAKAIVRRGMLGSLTAAVGDSLRWTFTDREGNTIRQVTAALSEFGTAEQKWEIPAESPLGDYSLSAELRRAGEWLPLAYASYRIAEYRPPEFLVDVSAPDVPRVAGDTLTASVESRYLFGAPMGRAAVDWVARRRALSSWELEIPGTDGYVVGESSRWWEDGADGPEVEVLGSASDTLDMAGRLAVAVPLSADPRGRAAQVTLQATVTDVNRQQVSGAASVTVHPAEFYVAAKPEGTRYFWRAGQEATVSILAVEPDGERRSGVAVNGVLVRREWHQVRRDRGGYAELVGEWVSDTVARCTVRTGRDPAACRFTPPSAGSYVVELDAADPRGRPVHTSLYRWTTGPDWVPWNDESQLRMDVIPDRARYAPGDTATVLFASPFTGAEAWVTVEREGLIEQRRIRVADGATTLRFPITEAYAPNAFVSIIVTRGRSAPPSDLDDPGRPAIRVGYAELRVTPESKRLTVRVEPLQPEYRPGDSTRVRLRVRDAAGSGQRSEVTLWAVDEGVLALTGYRTPDPIDLLYQARGLGLRLASTLANVVPQVPEGEKGRRNPGGGGGAENADILRSRFQTTAFFLGSVITDANGETVATARLPDNLTTFRVMAVAVTAGDRYGSGDAPLLVTRPLVARPALPRFVRPGDRFEAGVVVNQRIGGTPKVQVDATATGAATRRGAGRKTARLEAGRGREIRFSFETTEGDSAAFTFAAHAEGERDAVRAAVRVRPASNPRVHTAAGTVTDTTTVVFRLPADIDPARSSLQLGVGTSPLAAIQGARHFFDMYPYACTEQLASSARALIALYRVETELGIDSLVPGDARERIERAVRTISARQRADGGIGFWSEDGWTTPWLSAYAGLVLQEARAAGVPVSDSVLARLGGYLTDALHQPIGPIVPAAPVAFWYERVAVRLSDRVMAVAYLRGAGKPDRPAENELLRQAGQLAWEDRARLAEVLARGGDRDAARRLLEPLWAGVKIEGRRATLPAEAGREFYFSSTARPAAYLLGATIALDPSHSLIGPLIETLVEQQRRLGAGWNTQDFGVATGALVDAHRVLAARAPGGRIAVSARGRTLTRREASAAAGPGEAVPLTGLLEQDGDESVLRLRVESSSEAPVFFWINVTELPRTRAVRPGEEGIAVERWYEDYATGAPVTEVAAGALVRVRLRVTVPRERHMVVLDDALPAGLEAVDLSLRTTGLPPGVGAADSASAGPLEENRDSPARPFWAYGRWEAGWWSPFEHREMRDDRVVWFATVLWPGTYTATYVARATTPGKFVRPPAQAEEMYNRGVNGRSDGGAFVVTADGE